MTNPKDFRARFNKTGSPLPRPRNALNVLIVEPDATVAWQLSQMLQPRHLVTVAPTIRAALTALQTQRPHLMLTELDLPDGSGLELIARVHQAPALRHVLLLVVTNRNTLRDKIAAFEAGADEYLVKPITDVYLSEHVERLSLFGQVIRS